MQKTNLMYNPKLSKMKTKRLWVILTGALLAGMLVVSCEKTDVPDVSDIEDDALVENIFDDIFATVSDAEVRVDDLIFSSPGLKSAQVDSCPLITVDKPDTENWPKTITVDFGDGCEGFNDRVRTGKIIIVITGRYRMEGASKTVTLENYTINGISVEGTKTITNEGRNDGGNLVFSVSLTGGKLTLPDGKVATREVTRSREWVSGEATWNPWDDVYFITGTVTGVNFNGLEYTRTIITPLESDMACRFIKSGTIQFEATGKPVRVLDYAYGDPEGGCDNQALVTRDDGESRVITLRFRHPRLP